MGHLERDSDGDRRGPRAWVWVRWWAVPIVALAWAVVIAFVAGPIGALGGALLGAVNAFVGVLPAVGLRKFFDIAATGDPNQPR
jgi:hypothetical protein